MNAVLPGQRLHGKWSQVLAMLDTAPTRILNEARGDTGTGHSPGANLHLQLPVACSGKGHQLITWQSAT